jgi:hypothetical protein
MVAFTMAAMPVLGCIMVCMVSTLPGLISATSVLRPELGVYLEHIGTFNPTTEEIFATVIIPFPELPAYVYQVDTLDCAAMMPQDEITYYYNKWPNSFVISPRKDMSPHKRWVSTNLNNMFMKYAQGVSVCADYDMAINDISMTLLKYRTNLENSQADLRSILQEGDSLRHIIEIADPSRKKRALPLLFGLPILAAVKAIGLFGFEVHKYRRMNQLRKSVKEMDKRQERMQWFMMDQSRKQTLFQETTSDEIAEIQDSLNASHHEILSIRSDVSKILVDVKKLQDQMDSISLYIFHVISTASKMTSHVQAVFRNNVLTLERYGHILAHWKQAAVSLTKGQLSENIVSPTNLKTILSNISQSLMEKGDEYKLLSVNYLDYYHSAQVLYTLHENSIIVQIPIPLALTQVPPYHLYRLVTVFMPLDTSWFINSHKEYTKLNSDKEYIAIGKHNYVEFDQYQLSKCSTWHGSITCPTKHVYVDNNHPSCLKLLHHGYNMHDLMDHCQLYYYRGYRATPGLINTEHYIMLSGFGGVWTHRCEGMRQHVILKAKHFVLIPKKKFGCSCSVQNEHLYLEGTSPECVSELTESDLVFPLNALQVAMFSPVIPNVTASQGTLYHSGALPTIQMPALQVQFHEDKGVLADDFQGTKVPIRKVQKFISTNQEIYLTSADLVAAESRFENWFHRLKRGKIATFVLALIGTVTGMITLYLLYKFSGLSAMVASMALNPRRVTALPMLPDSATWSIINRIIGTITQAIFLFVCLMTCKMIWKMITHSRFTRKFIPRRAKPKKSVGRSDILVEISDGQASHVQYMASVAIHGSLIHELPQVVNKYPLIIAHEKHLINDIITIQWQDLDTITLSDQDVLALPEKLSIPYSEKYTIRHIVLHPYTVRVVITCENIVWQTSQSLLESRKRHWMGPALSLEPQRMFSKDKGQLPPVMQEDVRDHNELISAWVASASASMNDLRPYEGTSTLPTVPFPRQREMSQTLQREMLQTLQNTPPVPTPRPPTPNI